MNKFLKLLTLFLVLIMLVQSTVISVFAVAPLDVDTSTHQAAGQPSKYSSEYNSGQRDVVATTLAGTSASSYYTGSYTYDALSSLSSSMLQSSLKTLMTSTHKYTSSYNDCHNKADRTDCENGNGKVSLIYTSYSATMSQWNGWNREHVWPQSLGGGNTSGGGADLHHIRPSDAVVNSTRGNNKYGNVTNGKEVYGKNPATGYLGGYSGGSYFEPLDNVKGDVARICLYVWIRWGNSWGAASVTEVFQSVDVLLEWMLLDPVDTWELGRNEVVEDIQGNRNVFIDYPEYAWLVFGREVPDELVSPSGEASEGACDHTWSNADCASPAKCTKCGKTNGSALGHSWGTGSITTNPTCTTTGVKTYTCSRCSNTKTETVKANGHSFGDWIIDKDATETETGKKHRNCSICSETETVTIPVIGHNHNYSSVVTSPTCTSEGYTTYTCDCGDTYKGNYKDYLDHKYSNGVCSSCGQQDPDYVPEIPEYSVDDFKDVVNNLTAGVYTGEKRYNKICEAITIYNTLSSSEKQSVEKQYTRLKNIAASYNEEATATNKDSEALNYVLVSIQIATAALPFAALSLLKKKDF
ncbi:MAG: endonuclease [Clostridia bacterium]|nr:endonuclease [Clostridia bacterium]